jgi:hypothetical protein
VIKVKSLSIGKAETSVSRWSWERPAISTLSEISEGRTV